jgi:hypothetical protein
MTIYQPVYSNINFIDMCLNYYILNVLNLLLQQLVFDTFLTWKSLHCAIGFSVSNVCCTCTKAADEIRITTFFKYFRVKTKSLIVTTNKLTNSIVRLVTRGCGLHVGPRSFRWKAMLIFCLHFMWLDEQWRRLGVISLLLCAWYPWLKTKVWYLMKKKLWKYTLYFCIANSKESAFYSLVIAVLQPIISVHFKNILWYRIVQNSHLINAVYVCMCIHTYIHTHIYIYMPISVAEVCGRLVAGVTGSNPAKGMDVCLLCCPV